MKRTILLIAAAALGLAGCARGRHYARYHHERYYVSEEHPNDRSMVNDRAGNRTYVREYDRDYYGSPHYQNNMEPRVRGKHAESLGWNTENYYITFNAVIGNAGGENVPMKERVFEGQRIFSLVRRAIRA